METKSDDFVNVGIRIRPHNVHPPSEAIRLISKSHPVLFVVDRQQLFTFDNIFADDIDQEQVYKRMVKPLVAQALQGYNCTVFAYGQTGTGKTYTIGTDPQAYKEEGFILRTIDDFFNNQDEHKKIDISVSFFEIYNEKVYDLLSNNKNALLVKGFQVDNLIQERVRNTLDARSLLKLGCKNRHTGETKLNNNSSRSHAVFRIHCTVKHNNDETQAQLNLVDLAGSESAKRTGNEGSQFQEGININKGLFYVGRVVHALSTNMSHIPYRQSMITTVLRDSLNKANYITLVACISPDPQDVYETIQTLEFAQGAKRLRNKPEVNNVVQQFKNDHPNLFGSAVKSKFQTPAKRSNFYSLEGSGQVKRLKTVNQTWSPMNTIAETKNKNVSMLNNPMHSIRVSSAVSSAVFPSISPIVKRCFESVEATILRRMQDMPVPRISFGRCKPGLSQLIQDEIELYTSKNPRACSSPIENDNVCDGEYPIRHVVGRSSFSVAKRLNFDEQQDKTEENKTKAVDSKGSKRDSSTSLLDDDTAVPRCSTRLSTMKRPTLATHEEQAATFKVPNVPMSKQNSRKSKSGTKDKLDSSVIPVGCRQSVRLLTKKPKTPRTTKASPVKRTRQTPFRRKPNEKLPVPTPRLRQRPDGNPIPVPRKRLQTPTSTETNVVTDHYNNILNLLNNGDHKELQKLPSIGPKTAAQIFTYRKLNGRFASIADLANMSSWSKNGYQRFLKANLLNSD